MQHRSYRHPARPVQAARLLLAVRSALTESVNGTNSVKYANAGCSPRRGLKMPQVRRDAANSRMLQTIDQLVIAQSNRKTVWWSELSATSMEDAQVICSEECLVLDTQATRYDHRLLIGTLRIAEASCLWATRTRSASCRSLAALPMASAWHIQNLSSRSSNAGVMPAIKRPPLACACAH